MNRSIKNGQNGAKTGICRLSIIDYRLSITIHKITAIILLSQTIQNYLTSGTFHGIVKTNNEGGGLNISIL